MTDYQCAAGWDNEAGLASLSVQPHSDFFEPGRITEGNDGLDYADGWAFGQYQWGYLRAADYNTIRTELGLASAESAQMTARLRNRITRQFENKNVIFKNMRAGRIESERFIDVTVDVFIVGDPS